MKHLNHKNKTSYNSKAPFPFNIKYDSKDFEYSLGDIIEFLIIMGIFGFLVYCWLR